jgi:hypothetical protein
MASRTSEQLNPFGHWPKQKAPDAERSKVTQVPGRIHVVTSKKS